MSRRDQLVCRFICNVEWSFVNQLILPHLLKCAISVPAGGVTKTMIIPKSCHSCTAIIRFLKLDIFTFLKMYDSKYIPRWYRYIHSG
jgi:hypothetical protein